MSKFRTNIWILISGFADIALDQTEVIEIKSEKCKIEKSEYT